jgi:hypothetical protein
VSWIAYLRTLAITASLFGSSVYLFILILDPYQNVPFSLPVKRGLVTFNQRFSYPSVARSADYDSVVIGTSTSRLIKPAELDRALGGHFANLSMNSAMAYEQSQILQLFLRHHQTPRMVLIGMDSVWCDEGETYEKYTFRIFPEWMYDENPWNDLLYLFNDKAAEEAGRQLEFILGKRKPNYGPDGYADFTLPLSKYDLQKARQNIYKGRALYTGEDPDQNSLKPPELKRDNPAKHYPTHALLEDLLKRIPEQTKKVLFFVPYHKASQNIGLEECKARIASVVSKYQNTDLLDFMIPSPITTDDRNYWDAMHYNVLIADQIVNLMASGIKTKHGDGKYFRYIELTH